MRANRLSSVDRFRPILRSHAVAWSMVLLACCSSDEPTPGGDAAAMDSGAATGGAGGAGGATGGASGVGASAGHGGTTGGRGGAADAGGAAGSSRGGQAGTAGGVPDAGRGGGDGSNDTASADRDADTSRDTGVDSDDSADARADSVDSADSDDSADARADTSTPPPDAAGCGPLPSGGLYATFRVVSDVFYVSITNPPGIDQAIALWRGQSQANIPVGQLECGNGTHNCGWTWRMNPASVTFAEITIEVCDATPSYVQMNCPSFPNSQYCPWSAELIALRDCRTDPRCPAVPR